MIARQKLFWVKFAHTLIWIFFNLVLVYLFYAVLTDRIGWLFWTGIACILLESIVLVLNHWSCPLTNVARRYSDSPRDNFDIFLPEWLARHNKLIYSLIFGALIILYLYTL
ncbi:hypothetical protein [Flavilitoribacter nigricans]|uniref:DUF2784 family protein n=1 Tax=Flavilitoribacter nigricans (strain ATCC 23147 / DSM 23189 / NBRC 102662 / NCIMB 1420 / SS-2) TaxID=1122177 RepID=A0A2D0NDM2_FLAN2|nr:hypothetical protein [Flavilitoribacter nigricans]PHN06611.1 hypothetical protein CRP01_09940 [Flavilitoribacter nigricans DSM 23189 = NBRC 102662]